MRIWYQSMAPIHHLGNYVAAAKRHAASTCSPGVEVVFNGATHRAYEGRTPADVLQYPYAKHVVQAEAIDFCRQAERDGFDAVIIGSFSEPFLLEIRSLLDIPVVSMPESSLLVACSLAEQFALVTLAPNDIRRRQAVIRRHGVESRVTGIHTLSRRLDEAQLDEAFHAPQPLIEEFTAVAERAVEAGADLIIPAEGILSLILQTNGIRSIAKATVLDCVGVTLLYAELLANMHRRLGMGVGRRWSYLKPPSDLLDQLSTRN